MPQNVFARMRNAFSGPAEITTDKSMVPAGDQDATTPATPTTKDAELVSGTFVPDININATDSNKHIDHIRRVVDSFDEDKLHWQEKAVVGFLKVLAYIFPVVGAFFAGLAIGDAYAGGPLNLADAYNAFIHVGSLGAEFGISMLVYGAISSAKRIKSPRSIYLVWFIALTVLFLTFASGSGAAQWWLLEKHTDMSDPTAHFAAVFRVSIIPAVDICCLAFLSVMNLKSLKKFLQDMSAKLEGIEQANQAEIRIDQAQLKAAIDRQGALMDMQSKAQRASTWNQIEQMQSQAMIEQAKRNMMNSGNDDSGSYRRGRY